MSKQLQHSLRGAKAREPKTNSVRSPAHTGWHRPVDWIGRCATSSLAEAVRRDPLNKNRPLPRPLLCPICKSAVQELDRTGDATGFDCETDGKFKVANTVFAEQRVRNYTNTQWEAALRKAKQRTKAGEWPVIIHSDFPNLTKPVAEDEPDRSC